LGPNDRQIDEGAGEGCENHSRACHVGVQLTMRNHVRGGRGAGAIERAAKDADPEKSEFVEVRSPGMDSI